MSNANIWKNFIYDYVVENDLSTFYTDFLIQFEAKWDKLISGYNFEDLCQINNGNRLRPMLVYWGYLLNKDNTSLFDVDSKDLDYILDYCTTIETIHKMSLVIDDWIDNDKERNGAKTFHSLYGADSAVLFAVNLLLKGYLNLSNKMENTNDKAFKNITKLSLQISYEMTLGALNEVSSKNNIISLARVKEIINMETSSIIKNGIVIGYAAGSGCDSKVISLLEDVGYCCGYIFQALNDLEPYGGNYDTLIKHKGYLTTDLINNRKNIIIAYIYAWAEIDELNQLENLQDSTLITNYVSQLIQKYDIKNYLLNEIISLKSRIKDRFDKIEKITNKNKWCHHFYNFIEITILASQKRALGPQSYNT